jgi:hypothetical protein
MAPKQDQEFNPKDNFDLEQEFEKIDKEKSKVRRKIDALLEQKRLNQLIDLDDWDK